MMIVIGLMSGTSLDGIDSAVVEIHGTPTELSVALLGYSFTPFNAGQREQIFALFDPTTGTVDKICRMNFTLGELFATAAMQAIAETGLRYEDISLIGSHGQTIYHNVESHTQVKSTLQIGEAAVIAERTGISTVADFRVADIAAGGQGAPLVSYVDWLLLRHPSHTRVVQNIGGIANFTYLPPGDDPEGVFALDTGPGNMLIDDAVARSTGGRQTFDKGGHLASLGRVDKKLLTELMSHPFISQPLPKTTGREQFGASFGAHVWERGQTYGLSPEDIIATLTNFTAVSIADAYRRYLPQNPEEIILGGGGVHNKTLVSMLQEQIPAVPILQQEDLGHSSDAKEALSFAVLAYEAIHGRPGNLPSCTSAHKSVILGKIIPGANYGKLGLNLERNCG